MHWSAATCFRIMIIEDQWGPLSSSVSWCRLIANPWPQRSSLFVVQYASSKRHSSTIEQVAHSKHSIPADHCLQQFVVFSIFFLTFWSCGWWGCVCGSAGFLSSTSDMTCERLLNKLTLYHLLVFHLGQVFHWTIFVAWSWKNLGYTFMHFFNRSLAQCKSNLKLESSESSE